MSSGGELEKRKVNDWHSLTFSSQGEEPTAPYPVRGVGRGMHLTKAHFEASTGLVPVGFQSGPQYFSIADQEQSDSFSSDAPNFGQACLRYEDTTSHPRQCSGTTAMLVKPSGSSLFASSSQFAPKPSGSGSSHETFIAKECWRRNWSSTVPRGRFNDEKLGRK